MPSVKKIVEDGLCIGCGLCAGLSHDDVVMEMTDVGSLRPNKSPAADSKLGSLIAEVCPGIKVEPSHATGTAKNYDDVWGNFDAAHEAWSGDKTVRYESASGGVLTSLAISLLDSERIAFVLHVGADPERPIENCWVISRNADEVKRHSRSRYGPVAPLAGIDEALSFEQPFAMIGKPCDLNGLENLAYIDSRVDRYCVARLAMVCGGQSKLSKTRGLLREFGVSEEEVSEFRYRGYGNPGLTYAETKTGATFSTTYQELWEEEASWDLETRCKLCPDPLGESADVAALDVWPGGAPTGEDAGFNGVVVRGLRGESILDQAVESGHLVLGKEFSAQDLNDFQPHQVRKKRALASRFQALKEAGVTQIRAPLSRLEENSVYLDDKARQQETDGTLERIKLGKFKETLPD